MSFNRSILKIKTSLQDLYGNDRKIITCQEKRFENLSRNFEKIFGEQPQEFFSSPGRTEISGNHTDHNNGIVIAASINLDSIACVIPDKSKIEIQRRFK